MQNIYAATRPLDAAPQRKRIAVIGAGISGLSCAWALGGTHDVTLYEAESRLGGHSHTQELAFGSAAPFPVDTGFIVYNEPAYPNLTALFAHLGVKTTASDMSFAVSMDGGRLEYAGTDLLGLFAQRRNLLRPRFWTMLRELLRFYKIAAAELENLDDAEPLGAWLDRHGPFRILAEDHLLPMAAAIWSCPTSRMGEYPAKAFLRFCTNHGLLQVTGRPVWRTVQGGSRRYVAALQAAFTGDIRLGQTLQDVRPTPDGVTVRTDDGIAHYDDVVLACHAPQALALLPSASAQLQQTLGAFRTTQNRAVLHGDKALMPKRRAAWCSWNFIGGKASVAQLPCVTYWMNRLQTLPTDVPVFVTLNPPEMPRADVTWRVMDYAHLIFDHAALAAQQEIWDGQGQDRLWFAGAWLGAGFHEDGLQAGLAVAEALGGMRRPWNVANESGRMPNGALPSRPQILQAA